MISSFMLNTIERDLPCSIFYDDGNEAVIPHWHKEIEIIYCKTGETEMIINNRKFILKKGNIGVALGGDIHSYGVSINHRRTVILFDPALFEENSVYGSSCPTLRQHLESMSRISSLWSMQSQKKAAEIIERLEVLNGSKEFGRSIDVWARLCDLILLFCNDVPHAAENRSGVSNYNQIKMLESLDVVFNYIGSNYQKRITLNDAAALVNFNSSYFARYFHKATGSTFVMYLNSYRTNKARHLLISTNKSISEISDSVGFGAVKSFNRVFKQIIGVSPSEYRKRAIYYEEENTKN